MPSHIGGLSRVSVGIRTTMRHQQCGNDKAQQQSPWCSDGQTCRNWSRGERRERLTKKLNGPQICLSVLILPARSRSPKPNDLESVSSCLNSFPVNPLKQTDTEIQKKRKSFPGCLLADS